MRPARTAAMRSPRWISPTPSPRRIESRSAGPSASDRTLLDLEPGSLRMAWTYDNLTMPNYPLLSAKTPRTAWKIDLKPQIDGQPFAHSRWTRLDGVLPGLENVYDDPHGSMRLAALGGMTAAVVRIEVANSDSKPHQFVLRCDAKDGENPAWVDWTRNVGDNLVAGWDERADRVLLLGVGADAYSLQADGRAPGAESMALVWNLKPGQRRGGWLVRPYRAYAADLPALRKHDWARRDGARQARSGASCWAGRPRSRSPTPASRTPFPPVWATCSSCASRWPAAISAACPARKCIAPATPTRPASWPWPSIRWDFTTKPPPATRFRSICRSPTATGTIPRAGDISCGRPRASNRGSSWSTIA